MSITDLFNQIDKELLDRWISEARQEDLHLDFKVIALPNDLSRDDRKNLAVAISAFANSDGGIIVWGVESRKDPVTGIDAASALRPMQNARAILSKLQSHTGMATNPTVDGVLHRFVQSDAQDDKSGFIITFVPVSDRGPHMAKLGEDRYYKRSGDSFYKMEHFDIADMFGRRRRPRLVPRFILRPHGDDNAEEELQISLINEGRAVAKYVGFLVEFDNLQILQVGSNLRDISKINQGRSVVGYNHDIGVLHPNGIATRIGDVRFQRPDPQKRVTMKFTYYCEGASAETLQCEFPPRERLPGEQG